ncbi:thioesterase II family protein [Dactylosporangium sp. CA-139066]|uniref:thioesterase II family protein n=1 Tax=Dactylosporangium sp. CA-139066 TaxID=3239930 RepID=UPI003D8C956D
MSQSGWYVSLNDDAAAPALLFAFPHAGAGCAQFADLARAVAPHVGLLAANLPGRQARLDESPPDDLQVLTDRLADELAERVDRRPYALFGYCAGAVIAYLVARALRARVHTPPVALVVASHEAPDIARRPYGLAELPSDRLWDALVAAGGIQPEMAADHRLRRVAEPAVRADFALLAAYQHAAAPPLPHRLVVCAGRDDQVRRGALLGWRRQTTMPVELHSVPGGHWVLEQARDEVATVVRDTLAGER